MKTNKDIKLLLNYLMSRQDYFLFRIQKSRHLSIDEDIPDSMDSDYRDEP